MKPRIDRLLRLFSDVHPGEGLRALGMLASLLVLMVAYYVLKTVREPLVLATGGAEWKSYAAGLQALSLIAFVPAYTWLTRRVGRRGLIVGLVGFFFVNLQLFYVALHLGARFVGIAFFVWVGIFSLSVIAQFWSFANDVYSRQAGERLFPIIAFGATIGSPIGARIAQSLFEHGVSPAAMIQIAAALLVVHGAIMLRLASASTSVAADRPMVTGKGGFSLIARSSYLRLVALLLVLLNVVNTVGEYVLAKNVVNAAAHTANKAAFIGSFYGSFFFWVNVTAALLQAFLVSRLVKRAGVRGVLIFFPLLAFGVYAMMAAGVSFAVIRWLKTVDNATDYSVMNTGRAMLWLPTSREEKYRAKQAMDTFVVRFGDLIATAVVLVSTALLHLGPSALATMNAVASVAWIFVASAVARQNGAAQARASEPAVAAAPLLRAA